MDGNSGECHYQKTKAHLHAKWRMSLSNIKGTITDTVNIPKVFQLNTAILCKVQLILFDSTNSLSLQIESVDNNNNHG